MGFWEWAKPGSLEARRDDCDVYYSGELNLVDGGFDVPVSSARIDVQVDFWFGTVLDFLAQPIVQFRYFDFRSAEVGVSVATDNDAQHVVAIRSGLGRDVFDVRQIHPDTGVS